MFCMHQTASRIFYFSCWKQDMAVWLLVACRGLSRFSRRQFTFSAYAFIFPPSAFPHLHLHFQLPSSTMSPARQIATRRLLATTAFPVLLYLLLRHPRKTAVTVLLLNLKSLPFAHHLRFFYHLLKTVYFTSRHSSPISHFIKPKSDSTFVLNDDTLWIPRILEFRLLPDDMDWNIHMNNSSYNKQLDFARTDWVLGCLGWKFAEKYRVMNAGVCCWFRKEIAAGQKYVVESGLVGWGEYVY